jgi:hypothetical protein
MPALRGLRGSVVGLSASGLGTLGHGMAGGMLPSAPVMALATSSLVALGVALSGRPWGLASLVAVLFGSQLALHVVLAGTADGQAMEGMSGDAVPGASMTGAHLGAAVATAVVLRRGEQWCQALVGLLARPLRAVALTVLPLPLRRRLPVRGPARVPVRTRLASSLSRRGPPVLSPA